MSDKLTVRNFLKNFQHTHIIRQAVCILPFASILTENRRPVFLPNST